MTAAAISKRRRSAPYGPTNWRPTGRPEPGRPSGAGAEATEPAVRGGARPAGTETAGWALTVIREQERIQSM